jgi:hypothetical protein
LRIPIAAARVGFLPPHRGLTVRDQSITHSCLISMVKYDPFLGSGAKGKPTPRDRAVSAGVRHRTR